jgi:hypothetical protein
MKLLKLFVSSVLLFGSLTVFADIEECTMNYINSKLAFKTKAIKDKANKTLTQTLVNNGQEIIFVTGGCEHYSFSFEYTKVAVADKKAETVVDTATTLLNSTPTTKAGDDLKDILSKALANAKTDLSGVNQVDRTYYIPCADATCTIEIEVNETDGLRLGYMFAL